MSEATTEARSGAWDELAAEFGERFTRSETIRDQHGRSEAYHAQYSPEAVLFAETTEDVSRAVQICARHIVPVVAFGAGTSVEGNFSAVHGGLCIDLTRMDAILQVNDDDLDCTVQAGVTREDLNVHLRDKGLFFPIDPGANATIGGMASTRASGTNAVRYGTMRENILSLRVVLPDGRVVQTGGRARKSAAGYDLTRLYIGSEGTLGIITEISLKLHGIPETIFSAVCPFESLHGAVDTVTQCIQMGLPLARMELLDDRSMEAVNAWADTDYNIANTLFFEFHGTKNSVAEQVDMVRALCEENNGGDFRWASSTEDRNRLWKARHEAYYASLNLRPGAVGWTTDVCVPISRLADCIFATKAELVEAEATATILGHVGDGNFHTIFVIDPDKPKEMETAKRINRHLVERALDAGGTCTGEHGIGLGKIDWLEAELGEAVDVMRAIKGALDPQNIMNPGKIFRLGTVSDDETA